MHRLRDDKVKRQARAEEDDVPGRTDVGVGEVVEITEFEVPTADGTWQMDHDRTTVRTVAATDPNANLAWFAPISDTSQSHLLDESCITASTPSTISAVILQEEEALDGWPRRLLHVESLTSYEWQPGNIYGNVRAPRYNAITYTWGRWRVRPGEAGYERTPFLPVQGIQWDIPRVKVEHFSPHDFEKALRETARGHNDPKMATQKFEPVRFVWVDVACIDQREGEPRAAAEVGRQAAIFEKAQACFIWLGTLSFRVLKPKCDTLFTILAGDEQPLSKPPHRQDSSSENDTHRANVGKALSAFKVLLGDSWFSSLWTLQEAFLRNLDAMLMSQDAQVIYNQHKIPEMRVRNKVFRDPAYPGQENPVFPAFSYEAPFDLGLLLDLAQKLQLSAVEIDVDHRQRGSLLGQIKDIMRPAGMWELLTMNPLSVYTAASRRRAEREDDRIYGIQQVFGLRLGKTAVSTRSSIRPNGPERVVDQGRTYSLTDLEDQLGEQLLLRYPVLSQMHVYTRAVPPGKAWRVNESSVVPGVEEGFDKDGTSPKYPRAPNMWISSAARDVSFCRFDVSIQGGQVWGQFEGRACPFDRFWANCLEAENSSPLYKDKCFTYRNEKFKIPDHTLLDIWPDVVEELSESPESKGTWLPSCTI